MDPKILEELLNVPDYRQELFRSVLNKGVQRNYTSDSVVRKVYESTDLKSLNTAVFFNLEFLEPCNNKLTTFICDHERKNRFAKGFYGIQQSYFYDAEAWAPKNLDETARDIMPKIKDCKLIVSNPPFTDNLDLKLLLALQKHNGLKDKHLRIVHSAAWLFTKSKADGTDRIDIADDAVRKYKSRLLYNSFEDVFGKHISSLYIFNGNPVFNIGLFSPCVIADIDMSATYKVKKIVWFEENSFEIESLDAISMHGPAWDPLVKDFQCKVKKFCLEHGSLQTHVLKEENQALEKFKIQLTQIRGHVDLKNINKMYEDDFFTFGPRNIEICKGTRNEGSRKDSRMILLTDSRQEQSSLLGYLQTDFARLCLSLLKINGNSFRALQLVPWLDFTQSWNDDKLFSELGYHKGHAIRGYAKKLLPDYHDLYPDGKNY